MNIHFLNDIRTSKKVNIHFLSDIRKLNKVNIHFLCYSEVEQNDHSLFEEYFLF